MVKLELVANKVPPILAEYQRTASPLVPKVAERVISPAPHMALFVPVADAGMGFIVAVTAVLELVLSHPVEFL